jgi:hypothetical protein
MIEDGVYELVCPLSLDDLIVHEANPISPRRFSQLINFSPTSPTTSPAARHTTANVSQSPAVLRLVSPHWRTRASRTCAWSRASQ